MLSFILDNSASILATSAIILAICLSVIFLELLAQRHYKLMIQRFAERLDLHLDSVEKMSFHDFREYILDKAVDFKIGNDTDVFDNLDPIFQSTFMYDIYDGNPEVVQAIYSAYLKSTAYSDWLYATDYEIAFAI